MQAIGLFCPPSTALSGRGSGARGQEVRKCADGGLRCLSLIIEMRFGKLYDACTCRVKRLCVDEPDQGMAALLPPKRDALR